MSSTAGRGDEPRYPAPHVCKGAPMQIAKWDDSYKTGYAPVDLQHQELFRLINDLQVAILAKRDREILSATLEKLAKYTLHHFRTEEALMANVNYPQQTGHRRKHVLLAKEVEKLREEYSSGKIILSITLAMFLANWWRDHIKQDDMAFIKYVQTHRAAPAAKPVAAGR
jgi:hemerythrin